MDSRKATSDAARKAAEAAVDAWESLEEQTLRSGYRETLILEIQAACQRAIDSETAARQPAPAPDAEAEARLDEIRAAYQRSGKHAQITGDDIGLLLTTLRRTQKERDAALARELEAEQDVALAMGMFVRAEAERDAAYQRGREDAAKVADRVALEFHAEADVERGQGARAIADGLAAKGEGAEAVARAIRGGERG